MNEISKTISKFAFYAVAIVLLAWTASLTVTFVATALPNMAWYVPYLALVAFDGGMIAWLFVFLKYAEGIIQRSTALMLTILDFLGVALLVIAEILLGGQTFTEAPAALGTWAIWGIGIWTTLNVAGVILFHIGDPSAQKQMSIQNEKDAVWQGALKNLASRRTYNASALAEQLGGRMYQEMLAELFVDQNGDGRPDLLQARNGSADAAAKPYYFLMSDGGREYEGHDLDDLKDYARYRAFPTWITDTSGHVVWRHGGNERIAAAQGERPEPVQVSYNGREDAPGRPTQGR